MIYRFKFSPEFTEQIEYFAKVHEHDGVKDFREAWTQWKDTHQEILMSEINRLVESGFTGDIEKKMFRSVRYYYRNKSTVSSASASASASATKKSTSGKRMYMVISKELLSKMDEYIRENTHSDFSTSTKPAVLYSRFLEKEDVSQLFKSELERMKTDYSLEVDIIENRIKKAFKNKYFRNIYID